jgi:polyisoprenoid-binding protein YceI
MKMLTLLGLGLFCGQSFAAWQLDNEKSSLHFISTKKEHISEVHQFTQLNGSVSDDGQLRVEIALASVETNIDIRNQRMREKLFMVDKMPTATLSAKLPETLLNLPVGGSTVVTISAKLTLNGQSENIDVAVQVSRLSAQTLMADSVKPILINAADYKLAEGIEILKGLAGLPSISLAVPVNFNLSFSQQN